MSNLSDSVKAHVQNFLKQCGDMPPTNLYQLVIEQFEEPTLQLLMEKARNNQCRVTKWLELARGTVRKKLKIYGLIG